MKKLFCTLSDADRRRIRAEFGSQAIVAAYVAATLSVCAIVLLAIQMTRTAQSVQPNEAIQPVVWVNAVTANVTRYSKNETCPTSECVMSSGYNPDFVPFRSVACPRKYRLFTKILIDGVEYVCADHTAQWTDGRFDIWEGSDRDAHARAIKWGNQIKTVIIK